MASCTSAIWNLPFVCHLWQFHRRLFSWQQWDHWHKESSALILSARSVAIPFSNSDFILSLLLLIYYIAFITNARSVKLYPRQKVIVIEGYARSPYTLTVWGEAYILGIKRWTLIWQGVKSCNSVNTELAVHCLLVWIIMHFHFVRWNNFKIKF